MKKKYRLKKKNIFMILLVIIVAFVLVFGKQFVNVFRLMLVDYNFSEANSIYKSGIYEKVIEKGYSNTIANIADEENFVENNFELYYEIDYYDYDGFLDNVNKWLELGYSSKEINLINKEDDDSLKKYLFDNYVPNINRWIDYDFFKADNFERYLNYFDGDYKQTIVNVNIGLDQPFYENANVIREYSVDVLANKYNKLDSSFLPNNLTALDKCSTTGHYLSIDAKIAYDNLCEASIAAGMELSVNSSYRSYQDQEKVYNSYLELYGQSYVDKYVATPGYSEHQTGLALDVKSLNSSIFKNSEEYIWMLNNSYKYGFILRYPENKKDITGYNSEAWHFRYVGVNVAKYIYENNITYDEYYVMFLDN